MKPTLALLLAPLLILSINSLPAFAQQQLVAEQSSTAAQAPTANPAPGAENSPAPAPTPETQSLPPMSESDRLPFMQDNQSQVADSEAPSSFNLLLRTVGALLLIVGLVFGAAWSLRRFGGTRFGAAQPNAPPLTVLSTMPLGDRRSLAIVKFGDRTLLLGSTPQNITLIAEEEIQQDEELPPARSVAEMLKQNQEGDPFARELSDAENRLELIPAGRHLLDREGAA